MRKLYALTFFFALATTSYGQFTKSSEYQQQVASFIGSTRLSEGYALLNQIEQCKPLCLEELKADKFYT